MNETVKNLLEGKSENHMLPFFWLHGEDEATLREYVGVIQDAGCNAFCLESRPHPDFAGPGWWHDLDIIFDEAVKRGMQAWILDDSHFPTGYANGALRDADPSLCRQSLFCRRWTTGAKAGKIRFSEKKLASPPSYKMNFFQRFILMSLGKQRHYDDDRVLSITAYGPSGEVIDLTGKTEWQKPAGKWEIAACGLSRNLGPHRSYINMMSPESCHKLIEAVYEPHYERYKDLFGTTILGFFSDEPELGNGIIYAKHNVLGTDQDLPWSRELQQALEEKYGEGYKNMLPLLWKNDRKGSAYDFETEKFRNDFMDMVSSLVSKAFSQQLGDWCRAHGVSYIGHLIEDDDTHTCTGSGLGHYFRGIAGQDMAGIDDIGGQVLPQGEEKPEGGMFGPRNGGFYHYTLGKLGPSAAYLDQKKQGRTMCEIFGNYGWQTGVSDMKYLADHFLVRGVNYFVPHAFSPKEYPDKDCPPHFYANGNNPQYRFIGDLFRYMNRVANMTSGGEIVHKAAILYNAEADWAGEAETMDRTARVLYDHQIDFSFLPLDSADRAGDYEYVLIPPSKYWPEQVLDIPNAVFVDALPDNLAGSVAICVKKADLPEYLSDIKDAVLRPANPYLHCLHYRNESDIYFFVNEGKTAYRGVAYLPVTGNCYIYDAWNNRILAAETEEADGRTRLSLDLDPRKSLMIVFDKADTEELSPAAKPSAGGRITELTQFTRSICRASDYPYFECFKDVILPDELSREEPEFSGHIRYASDFDWTGGPCLLTITGVCEGVEVFVNGISAGRQVVPDYKFDISGLVRQGRNDLEIETATTLQRERASAGPLGKAKIRKMPATGITGRVYLQN